ncbi:hypothetical protein BGZ58_010808 [Dissophora ornata]|nr:hypothetical protein BGZ58_010808 [Dissophora ornata]
MEPPTLLQYDIPFMHLQELSLVFCLGITNGGFQTLFRSFRGKSLRSLDLQFTNIEDSGLEALATAFCPYTFTSRAAARASHVGLTSVKVSYCSKITARGIRALVIMCPQLLELEFLCCDLVSADCFKGPVAWACTGLRRLEFTLHPTLLFSKRRQVVEAEEREPMISTPQQVPEHALDGVPDNQYPRRLQDKDLIDGQRGSQKWPKMVEQQHENTERHRLLCEQESIRTDYHAMFRQLKQLSDLQSLHIYNSPALNTTASLYDPDHEEASAPSVPEDAVNLDPSIYSILLPAGIEHDRTEYFVASMAGAGGITEGMSRQVSEDYQDNSDGEIAESSNAYAESVSAAVSRTIVHGVPLLTPAPVHPFSLRMGFKALRRLKNLQTLTLYERSSISLSESEVWWIGKMFPQLSLLELRGSIEISDFALARLRAMRPRVRLQVCPLFEN